MMVTDMPGGILCNQTPDFNKIACELKPRIHLTMDDEHLFRSSDRVNWILKLDREPALELAQTVLGLDTKK